MQRSTTAKLRHIEVIRVEVKTGRHLSEPVRAFIPISLSAGGRISEESYIPARRVANSPSMRRTVMEQAHADFLAWLERYERYDEFMKEFSPVVRAYRELTDKLSDAG